jgi:mannose-6-phosphate isomerase-like protein (cupin superfamily)
MEHWFKKRESITFNNSLALFHCGHEQCRPSHSFGPAVRPHYLFHYILGGKGKYHAKGETYGLSAGQGF